MTDRILPFTEQNTAVFFCILRLSKLARKNPSILRNINSLKVLTNDKGQMTAFTN